MDPNISMMLQFTQVRYEPDAQPLLINVVKVSMTCSVKALQKNGRLIINPRRACARVTVVVLSVCVCICPSVCLSVPALAASASVGTSKQRYLRVSLRLFLD